MSAGAIVVVQARMSSRRLPGKVLLPLAGRPALVRMLERLARVRRAERIVVATSTDPSDDAVAQTSEEAGVACVRGPLDDVLARFLLAIPESCRAVVRLTADCPLVDPALVDRHLELFLRDPAAEYVTNAVVRTFPDGLDVEVVSPRLLREAARSTTSPYDREHVTPWVQRHARRLDVTQPIDLSALRWTLDTADDYAMLSGAYEELWPRDPAFGSDDVCRLLLRRPALLRVAGVAVPDGRAWAARLEEHLARREAET